MERISASELERVLPSSLTGPYRSLGSSDPRLRRAGAVSTTLEPNEEPAMVRRARTRELSETRGFPTEAADEGPAPPSQPSRGDERSGNGGTRGSRQQEDPRVREVRGGCQSLDVKEGGEGGKSKGKRNLSQNGPSSMTFGEAAVREVSEC